MKWTFLKLYLIELLIYTYTSFYTILNKIKNILHACTACPVKVYVTRIPGHSV